MFALSPENASELLGLHLYRTSVMAWFRLPLLVQSLLFWAVMQHWYVVSYRHFGPAYEFRQVLDPWT